MICVGARFDDRVTGRLDAFSPNSKKIHIDIDASSINKNVRVDIGIIGDAASVLDDLIEAWKVEGLEANRTDPAAPFCGVPFLVKDLIAALAGEPTGQGTRTLAGLPMPHDSALVQRWRAAGLLILGRTNTPEFGLTPYTEPLAHGPTRNPWAPGHTPGGSSGGSAAAVAARGWTRGAAAGAALVGTTGDAAAVKAAVTAAVAAINPTGDNRGPAEFKRHIAGIIIGRAITRALSRA
jgi:hypothetical protein